MNTIHIAKRNEVMEVAKLARKLLPLAPERIKRWRLLREQADPDTGLLLDKELITLGHRLLGESYSRPLLSLPSKRRAFGQIRLGKVLYEKEKWPFGISEAELLQNLAIFGRSGAGKTNAVFLIIKQLTDRKIPFLFLDWKRTARHLVPGLKGKVQIYTPGRSISPFPFNPFIVPPATESRVHINQVVDVMGDAYTLGDGARSLIQKALTSVYGRTTAPTATDLLQEIEKVTDRERIRGWKISAIRALESLAFAQFTGLNEGAQLEFAEGLLHQNTIVELDGLSASTRKFLIPLLCLWLYSVKLACSKRESLQYVVVVEEAHHLLYGGPRSARETLMEMLLRQCRELGIAMIVVDQHPHLISSAALGNTYTSICLNLKDPKDVNKAADLSLVDDPPENTERRIFSRLPVGQAVVKLQDRWTEPVLIRMPHVAINKGSVSDRDVKQLMQSPAPGTPGIIRGNYLGVGTRSIPRGQTPGITGDSAGSVGYSYQKGKHSGGLWAGKLPGIPGAGVLRIQGEDPLELGDGYGISDEALRFIEDVIKYRNDGVRRRYQRLGMSGEKGNRLKVELINQGWLEGELVARGTTRTLILGLTRKGKQVFGKSDENKYYEGLAHSYWKHFYAERFKRSGWKVKVEAIRAGGKVDVMACRESTCFGIEIETGKSDVVANVRNCLKSGFKIVIVIATDEKALSKVEAALAKEGLIIPGRVVITLRDQLDMDDLTGHLSSG